MARHVTTMNYGETDDRSITAESPLTVATKNNELSTRHYGDLVGRTFGKISPMRLLKRFVRFRPFFRFKILPSFPASLLSGILRFVDRFLRSKFRFQLYIYISRFYLNRMNSAFRSIDSIRETSKQKEFNGFERYFSLNMKEDAIENGGFCIGESFYPLIILLELWRNAMPFNNPSRKSNTRKIVFLERDVATCDSSLHAYLVCHNITSETLLFLNYLRI